MSEKAANQASPKQMDKLEESFRRSVMKLSAAGKGVHKLLDAKLEEVRQAVRDKETVDQIATRVEAVTQVLMGVEEDKKLMTELYAPVDVVEELARFTRKKSIKKQLLALMESEDCSGDDLFKRVAKIYLGEPEKSGLFDWLGREKKTSQSTTLTNPVELIRSQLLQLLTVVVLDKTAAEFSSVKNSIERAEETEDIADALETLSNLAMRVRDGERQKLSAFVQQLGQRLDKFDALLNDSNASHQGEQKENSNFNQALRTQLSDIKKDVQQATSLQELSGWIDNKLSGVINSLDDFQQKLQDRQQQEKQRVKELENNLSAANQTTQKLSQALAEAKVQAHTDSLTELPNRLAFDEKLAQEIARCQRYERPLSLAMTDIDFFKKVNDTYGHQAGDKVLQMAVSHCKMGLRETDFMARIGGEEFVIVMPETDISQAKPCIEKLRKIIESKILSVNQTSIKITMSFGIAQMQQEEDAAKLIERADKALYEAKNNGRNQVRTA